MEMKFWFDPEEPAAEHEARWDKDVQEQWDKGLTLSGLGPDGDWPIRIEDAEGNPFHPGAVFLERTGGYYEVYDLVPRLGIDGHQH